MKLLNGRYKIRNRIMAAFLAVTMLLTLVPTGQMYVYAAGEGKVNVDSFTVKVNGEPLENVTEITEGDQVLILCDWSLDDSDKTVDTYKVDLSSMLSDLKLVAGMPATVYDSELGEVGTVTIDENGVATYVFTNADMAGGKVMTDQIEGGQEIQQSAMIMYEASKPVTGMVSRGAELFKQQVINRQKLKIKKVDAGKKLAKKGVKGTAKKWTRRAVRR